jgi:hypothetical protein
MTARLYLAILWAGAQIVRENERAEWRAEWQTELWYAMEEGGGRRVTSYCLGSLRDALWKRRNAGICARYGSVLMLAHRPAFPEPPVIECTHPLESPFRCLGLLGLLALVAILTGMPASGARPGARLLPDLLVVCAMFWPVVALMRGAVSGEYPRHRNWLRPGCFYLAKMTLLLLIVAFGASDYLAFSGAFLAIRWAMRDQQRRCPTCLRLLAKPVRMGSRSRILLEWNGIELLCLRGHGVMHVPENPAIWFRKPRWVQIS